MTSETAALRGPLRKKKSHLWDRHPQDWYIEPSWCSKRLFEVENFNPHHPIYDPACGLGRILASAKQAGYQTIGSDIVDRLSEDSEVDFALFDFLNWQPQPSDYIETIVSNPPFGVAQQFAEKALDVAFGKIALLLPLTWIGGLKRSQWLEATPLARILIIAPRPSMPPGPVIVAGEKPGNGTKDFAWFIWNKKHVGPPSIGWLRRDGDAA